MTIKISHYAFDEGRAGYGLGCSLEQNPYADGKECNKRAAKEWADGWKLEEQIWIDEGVAL